MIEIDSWIFKCNKWDILDFYENSFEDKPINCYSKYSILVVKMGSEINSCHPKTKDASTHVLIFNRTHL